MPRASQRPPSVDCRTMSVHRGCRLLRNGVMHASPRHLRTSHVRKPSGAGSSVQLPGSAARTLIKARGSFLGVARMQKVNRPTQPDARSMTGLRALILVVERDPHVRRLERYFLEDAGFAVEFATDGEQALLLAQRHQPAIVITEILVPKRDGLSVCRALKADPATHDMIVLVLSILAAEDRAREAGADAFLRKPVNECLLVDSVRKLLGPFLAEGHSHGPH
jgi:CheY-like chemotaxis protein